MHDAGLYLGQGIGRPGACIAKRRQPYALTSELSEDGGKDRKIRSVSLSQCDLGASVAGNADGPLSGHESFVFRKKCASISGGNIVGAEMDAVSAYSQRDVNAMIDQKSRLTTVLFRIAAHSRECVGSKTLQIARRKILLAQLDIVNAGAGCFGDLDEQPGTPVRFSAGELMPVSDVAENHRLGASRD